MDDIDVDDEMLIEIFEWLGGNPVFAKISTTRLVGFEAIEDRPSAFQNAG